jgi:catechol 2,3-dioxygenase-like lactoylglutathione lyase family enzyme
MNQTFKTFHHVCIVVEDMERVVSFYESIGIGPWQPFPSLEPFRHELDVPNADDFMDLEYRFTDLDNVQLQLCAPPKVGTLHRRFLDAHGEAVFHLGFSVDDCDAAEAYNRSLGLTPKLGRLPNRNRFTYFDTDGRGAGVILQIRTATKPW